MDAKKPPSLSSVFKNISRGGGTRSSEPLVDQPRPKRIRNAKSNHLPRLMYRISSNLLFFPLLFSFFFPYLPPRPERRNIRPQAQHLTLEIDQNVEVYFEGERGWYAGTVVESGIDGEQQVATVEFADGQVEVFVTNDSDFNREHIHLIKHDPTRDVRVDWPRIPLAARHFAHTQMEKLLVHLFHAALHQCVKSPPPGHRALSVPWDCEEHKFFFGSLGVLTCGYDLVVVSCVLLLTQESSSEDEMVEKLFPVLGYVPFIRAGKKRVDDTRFALVAPCSISFKTHTTIHFLFSKLGFNEDTSEWEDQWPEKPHHRPGKRTYRKRARK
jgi:hypothetical protein